MLDDWHYPRIDIRIAYPIDRDAFPTPAKSETRGVTALDSKFLCDRNEFVEVYADLVDRGNRSAVHRRFDATPVWGCNVDSFDFGDCFPIGGSPSRYINADIVVSLLAPRKW